jgi:hypothetical protein
LSEAEDVFAEQVARWRVASWDTLRSNMKESPVVYEIEGSAGLNHQFEVLLMWDDPREETNIRVIIASDDGKGWRMSGLRGNGFIRAPDGSFVGEDGA